MGVAAWKLTQPLPKPHEPVNSGTHVPHVKLAFCAVPAAHGSRFEIARGAVGENIWFKDGHGNAVDVKKRLERRSSFQRNAIPDRRFYDDGPTNPGDHWADDHDILEGCLDVQVKHDSRCSLGGVGLV